MPATTACFVCGTELPDSARSCHVCGTSVPTAPAPAPDVDPPAASGPFDLLLPRALGPRVCPTCGKRYDASFADSFCPGGDGLVADLSLEPAPPLEGPEPDLQPAAPPAEEAAAPAMTGPRLVVYSADRQP